ncbi:MAG TPA: TetR/AcrR family transcriptional regulator [Polyangiaceae bacterium]|nr:TetR/AcrR family transcriptional regulator [Polyangiaceae bacterium]
MESIVDAAAHVFAEDGFEAATMESIAERAKTSIGSLYQFFPNKLAVFEALAGRSIERSRAAVDELLDDKGKSRSWRALIDDTIDRFASLREADPDFRAMLVNFQLYGVYAEADKALHRHTIERVAVMVRRYAPGLAAAQRRIVATLIVEIISALLLHAQREEPAFAKKLMEETKTLLYRYLSPYIDAPRPSGPA